MCSLQLFKKSLFGLVFILQFPSLINSQVIVILENPPMNQLKSENLWNLQLNNTTQNFLKVYLEGTISNDADGTIAEATCAPFELKPRTTRIKLSDLKNISSTYNKKYEEMLIRTGTVPSGDYEICVRVLNDEDGIQLGEGCISHTVMQMSPPELLSPENDVALTEIESQNIVFQWLPPAPISPGTRLTYDLKIVEVMSNQTPEGAILNNPVWYQQENITSTNLRYPLSASAFRKGASYAWHVFVKANGIGVTVSEVASFQLVPETECRCEDGSWDKVIVKYDNNTEVLDSCDVTMANPVMLGTTIYLEPYFMCNPSDCMPSYTGRVQDQNGVSDNLNYPISYTPSATGTYKFTITPSCGRYRCPPCNITVIVEDSSQVICDCEDGYWAQVEATYPGGVFPDGNVRTADCNGTFIAYPGANIKFTSSYTCNNPECPVTYEYTKQVDGGNIDGPFSCNFPIEEWFYSTGTYVYTITPYCDEQACPPCSFTVEVNEAPCGCGEWGRVTITLGDSVISEPCGTTFLTTTVDTDLLIEPDYMCSNPGPSCPKSFHYASRVDFGAWSNTTIQPPGVFTYTPDVPGYHEVKIIPQCGQMMCDSCIVGIKVEPETVCRCEDSQWLGTGVKYFDDNNIIDKGTYQCDETVAGYASLGTQVSLQPAFLCYPDTCGATLNIQAIQPDGNPDTYSDPYDLQTYGVYKFVITPTCGDETCPPCSISVIVRDTIDTCECGEWGRIFINSELAGCNEPPIKVVQGTNLVLEPTYICSPPNCQATFKYFTDLNSNPTSFTNSFSYDADILGTHEVCIIAECGQTPCDTCCYKIEVDSLQTCSCDSSYWKDVSVLINDNTIDYDACGKTLTASKDAWIEFNPNFICIPLDCPKSFKYEVSLDNGPFTTINNLPYQMDSYGTYLFEITAICDQNECPPCSISVTVGDSIETCECGEWNDVTVKYDPGTDVTKPCGFTFPSTTINTNIKIETSIQCIPISPVCNSPQYSYMIYNNTTGWNSGVNPATMPTLIDFTPSEYGDYTFVINAVCNQDTCESCEINIHVDSLASQCYCGENVWKGMSLEIENVSNYIPAPFCGTTLLSHANVGDKINSITPVFFCDPVQTCNATFELYVQEVSGINTPLAIPYTFNSQGVYIFTVIPHCGNDICDSCSFKIIVDSVSTECGCDEGNWDPIEVKFNGISQPGPILCGETVQNSAFVNESIGIITGYNCYPSNSGCVKTYTYSIYKGNPNNSNSTMVEGPIGAILNLPPINYTPQEPGLYTIVINTTCGQDECPPCSLKINVVEKPCGCNQGQWSSFEVKYNNGPVISRNCGGTLNDARVATTLEFNANYECCTPSAQNQIFKLYNVTIYRNGTAIENSLPMGFPFNYSLQSTGDYVFEFRAKCGIETCLPCSLRISVLPAGNIHTPPFELKDTSTVLQPFEPVDTTNVTPAGVPIGTEISPGDATITGGLTSCDCGNSVFDVDIVFNELPYTYPCNSVPPFGYIIGAELQIAPHAVCQPQQCDANYTISYSRNGSSFSIPEPFTDIYNFETEVSGNFDCLITVYCGGNKCKQFIVPLHVSDLPFK